MRRPVLALALVLLGTTWARADRYVEAIGRRAELDLAWLRARLPEDSARCALGVAYVFLDDLTRASHLLAGCERAPLRPGVAGWVRLAVRALADRLQLSELSPVAVTTQPAGLVLEIDTVPGEVFATPATIWLPAGEHAFGAGEATVRVTVRARTGAAVHVIAPGVLGQCPSRVDPRVAVMQANDCARLHQRSRGRACDLAVHDDDDPDFFLVDRPRPRLQHVHYDPLTMILQTAEER